MKLLRDRERYLKEPHDNLWKEYRRDIRRLFALVLSEENELSLEGE